MKKIMKSSIAIASVALLIGASAAQARCCVVPDYPNASDYYAGVGVGVNRSTYGTSRGLNALFGYRMSDHFAAEIGYAKLGKFTEPGTMVSDNASVWAISLFGRKPIYQYSPISGYGKIGYSTATMGSSTRAQKNYDVNFGAGVEIDFQSFLLRVGLDRYNTASLPLSIPPLPRTNHIMNYNLTAIYDF